VADSGLQGRQLAVLDRGERLSVQAGSDGARFLLVAGRAIGEPIVQYGPFVMNTRTEIERALKDYSEGRLVQTKADMINH
jgi:redox-sensitive bicupin YhaK (pirin superfamily)